LTIRYGDYQTADSRTTFPYPADCDRDLQEGIRDCFERLYQRRLPLRLLGLVLAPLMKPDPQPALFSELTDSGEEHARRLADCKDAIRHRYGFTALLSGSALMLANGLDRDRENFRLRTPCLTR